MIENPAIWSLDMPTHKVNLDALIRRESFEFDPTDTSAIDEAPVFKLGELEKGQSFYNLLRKPDFQRVTHNWTPQVVAEFVRSFLDGDVIPGIIIWQSKKTNKVYLIDGSHRVSALLAWVNNDYGDGLLSKDFFDDISPAQQKMATQTEALIKERVGGTYLEFKAYNENQDTAPNEDVLRRANAIGTKRVTVQAVLGNAKAAADSFIRINGNPAIIDKTELDVIRARFKPNAIATRAILSAGTGFKYWGKFDSSNIGQIESLGKECYDLLFGDILDINIESSDVPRGGNPYSQEAFTMVLDLVNIFNEITPAMWQTRSVRKKNKNVRILDDDPDGSRTIQFLNTVKTKASYASSRHFYLSLGLDPAVYCYGNTGAFHTGAYLASRKFVLDLNEQNLFGEFTTLRHSFEEFLVNHRSFINQLSHSKGSRTRSVQSIQGMLSILFQQMRKGVSGDAAIISEMRKNKSLKGLEDVDPEFNEKRRKTFSPALDRARVVISILKTRDICPECKARLAPAFRSREHIQGRGSGGMGDLANFDLLHPFCNTWRENGKHLKSNNT